MKHMPRSLRLFFFSAFALMLGFAASAQVIQDPTSWTYEAKKLKDSTYELIFRLKLEEGWHIWALEPGGDGLQFPPSFSFDKNERVQLKGKIKEQGKSVTGEMEGVDGIVTYFHGQVVYRQQAVVRGNTTIKGSHQYQVCTDMMCLPPKTKSFSIAITDAGDLNDAGVDVGASSTGEEGADADTTAAAGDEAEALVPATDGSAGSGQEPENPGPAAGGAMSNLALFLSGMGNGLLSVITPCVFAMLPMTVSFFLKRSKDRKTGIKIAIQYSLSIIFIFTFIGGLLSAFFGPDALHAFSTNGIVNLIFFIIFLIFGISFLGAFEINLPSSWATKLDSKANTRNFIGIFFMALTLVIVSFSCTVPFIGNLVVTIQNGGKIGPLLGFFGFGLGLALPFTLFAIFPSLLQELGKSGGWLNAVKVTFGFVELALALKFLSNADLQYGWRLLDRDIFIAVWMTLSFVLGFYLLGFIRFSHDSELPKNDWGLPYLTVPRLFFAISAFVFGFYLLPGMWGAPLNGMGAFVPPMGTHDFVLASNAGHLSAAESAAARPDHVRPRKYVDRMKMYEPAAVLNFHLDTYYEYEEALAASKALKKPVMLDFTGINCANCRKFEAEVWSKPEVLLRMKNDFIIASLFADVQSVKLPEEEQHYSEALGTRVTTLGDRNVELQVTKFNSNTQPYYFFVDENGVMLADKGVSYPMSPDAFVEHLEKVKKRYRELHPE
jgi:thiol:disulfide interchange protein